MTLSSAQLLLSRDWSSFYSLWATDRLERGVEDPFCRNLDGVVEHVWEEGYGGDTQLRLLAVSHVRWKDFWLHLHQWDPTSSTSHS